MSRAVVKTKKVGQINLGSMTKSNEITITISKLESDIENPANPAEYITAGKVTALKWKRDGPKPAEIDEAFRQIKMMFDVGTEVDGYTAFYLPPAKKNERGRYEAEVVSLGKAPFETAARMVLVLGTRDMMHISASGAGVSGEGQIVIQKNWCHSLPLGFCSQATISFNNVDAEDLPPRKGFRAGIKMRKDPTNRHIIVFDLCTSNEVVAQRIKREIAASKGQGPARAPDIEAAIAKARSAPHGAGGPVEDDEDDEGEDEEGTVTDVVE